MIGSASMLGAAIEGFAAPLAEAEEGDPNASFYSFMAFFSIAVVLYFLLRNMNSRMRRMSYRQQRAGLTATDPQVGPDETAPAPPEDAGASSRGAPDAAAAAKPVAKAAARKAPAKPTPRKAGAAKKAAAKKAADQTSATSNNAKKKTAAPKAGGSSETGRGTKKKA